MGYFGDELDRFYFYILKYIRFIIKFEMNKNVCLIWFMFVMF